MGKSCISYVRVLMVIFNVMFTIIGMAILAAGLYFYFSTFGTQELQTDNVLAIMFIGIAVIGALTALFGLLGCCGACHSSRCLLGCYFILLLIVVLIEVAVGVMGFINREEARMLIDENIQRGVAHKKASAMGKFHWIDTIQFLFDCCGHRGPVDYLPSKAPDSCCRGEECPLISLLPGRVEGCSSKTDSIMQNYSIILISVLIIAVVEILGLVFSMVLCCDNGMDSHGYYYAGTRSV